ncbi:hypothetical protein [Salinisphaera sp. T31B1]|uniref:hypothetical protein n=1 Tax=Salinisphaera sp. T31B1 TaxID=727963 RepID=UPI00333FD700
MKRFRACLRPWLAMMLMCLITFSAQAWAGHVDLAVDHEPGRASLSHTAAVSGVDTGHAEHAEHCCHGSAHLLGLHAHPGTATRSHASRPGAVNGGRYDSVIHTPPVDPPIV